MNEELEVEVLEAPVFKVSQLCEMNEINETKEEPKVEESKVEEVVVEEPKKG